MEQEDGGSRQNVHVFTKSCKLTIGLSKNCNTTYVGRIEGVEVQKRRHRSAKSLSSVIDNQQTVSKIGNVI